MADAAWMVEALVDGLTPEAWALLAERLGEAGALDVFRVEAVAGLDRPLSKVSVVVAEAERAAIEQALIEQATTFEVRAWPIERTAVEREDVVVTTRWGDVRLTLRIWRGRVLEAIPDDEDCANVARTADAPFSLIRGEAQRLGDAFVGQRRSASA